METRMLEVDQATTPGSVGFRGRPPRRRAACSAPGALLLIALLAGASTATCAKGLGEIFDSMTHAAADSLGKTTSNTLDNVGKSATDAITNATNSSINGASTNPGGSQATPAASPASKPASSSSTGSPGAKPGAKPATTPGSKAPVSTKGASSAPSAPSELAVMSGPQPCLSERVDGLHKYIGNTCAGPVVFMTYAARLNGCTNRTLSHGEISSVPASMKVVKVCTKIRYEDPRTCDCAPGAEVTAAASSAPSE